MTNTLRNTLLAAATVLAVGLPAAAALADDTVDNVDISRNYWNPQGRGADIYFNRQADYSNPTGYVQGAPRTTAAIRPERPLDHRMTAGSGPETAPGVDPGFSDTGVDF